MTLQYKHLIALLSLLLIIPGLIVSSHFIDGYPGGQSTNLNYFWYKNFADQFYAGDFLPRWLHQYFFDVGGPVFYFYAPFPFYLLSFLEPVFSNDTYPFLTLSVWHFLAYSLSGLSFYIFIRPHANSYVSMFAACLYIVLPYHVIDIEIRATLGESMAYIWFPMIAHSLVNIRHKHRQIFIGSIGYCLLVLSHLPSALLASLFIFLTSAIAGTQPTLLQRSTSALLIGIIGVVLSSFYILPALFLREYISPDAWVTASGIHLSPENHLIGSEYQYQLTQQIYNIFSLTTMFALAILVSCILMSRKNPLVTQDHSMRIKMIQLSILSVFMIWFLCSPIALPIWQEINILRTVQFPWRLGVFLEFYALVIITISLNYIFNWLNKNTKIKKSHLVRLTVVFSFFVVSAVLSANYLVKSIQPESPQPASKFPSSAPVIPVEYRSIWLTKSKIYQANSTDNDFNNILTAEVAHNEGFERWVRFVFSQPPYWLEIPLQQDESINIKVLDFETIFFELKLTSANSVTLRKMYFPIWEIQSSQKNLGIGPDENAGLIKINLPPGTYTAIMKPTKFMIEDTAAYISIGTLVLFLFYGLKFSGVSRRY